MSVTPHLQLIVPGLCGPLPDTRSLAENKILQECYTVLAKARVKATGFDSVNALLANIFNLPDSSLPHAALTVLGYLEQDLPAKQFANESFLKNILDKDYYLFHADPVYLRADMDHAILVGTRDLNVATDEARQLCEHLTGHFGEDGASIFAVDAEHWFVCTRKVQSLETVSLDDAIGRNVNFILPSGEDQTYWRQFLNESQMLLYMHPINQQRENIGQLPINSVWLHGGGQLSQLNKSSLPDKKTIFTCANNAMVTGLATISGCQFDSLPDKLNKPAEQASFYTRISRFSSVLVFYDDLVPWLNYTDSTVWQQQLERFYKNWMLPLLEQVRLGKLTLSIYPGKCHSGMPEFFFNRYYPMRFWRSTKAEDYVSHY